MRNLTEVLEALSERWDAPLKEIDGFSYVPWEETAYHLSEVFGPLGWSFHLDAHSLDEKDVMVNTAGRDEKPNYVPRTFQGYSCFGSIEVQVFDDVYETGVIRATYGGVGFAPIQAQGNKNPLDTAAKAAKSDLLSVCAKLLGDAFALYLYREKKRSGGVNFAAHTNNGTSAPKYPASEAQKQALINKFKLPSAVVDTLSKTQASTVMKGVIEQQLSIEEAVKAAGAAWVESAPKNDGIPIPSSGRR